jgi:hypothetical protein
LPTLMRTNDDGLGLDVDTTAVAMISLAPPRHRRENPISKSLLCVLGPVEATMKECLKGSLARLTHKLRGVRRARPLYADGRG